MTDAGGATATGTFSVTVANMAPAVTIGSPISGKAFVTGATVSVSASFTDAGTADTHTCTISWGDGKIDVGTVSETGGAGSCTGSNIYRQAGNYTITVTVVDSSGAATSKTVSISVTKNGGGTSAGLYAAEAFAVSSPQASRWIVGSGWAYARHAVSLLGKREAKNLVRLVERARPLRLKAS